MQIRIGVGRCMRIFFPSHANIDHSHTLATVFSQIEKFACFHQHSLDGITCFPPNIHHGAVPDEWSRGHVLHYFNSVCLQEEKKEYETNQEGLGASLAQEKRRIGTGKCHASVQRATDCEYFAENIFCCTYVMQTFITSVALSLHVYTCSLFFLFFFLVSSISYILQYFFLKFSFLSC